MQCLLGHEIKKDYKSRPAFGKGETARKMQSLALIKLGVLPDSIDGSRPR